ncbi:MAG TPA: DUF6438 domain-containing protein [Kofleriaceae bacterium]
MWRVLVAALVMGACWTGAEPAPIEPARVPSRPVVEPVALRFELERTMCFGACPVYRVVIAGDGRVEWTGAAHVIAMGKRYGKVTRGELKELSRRLDDSRFFERDGLGELPQKMECQTIGSSKTCSFGTSFSICSDTSHTIFTATRGSRTHKIDNAHCNDNPALDELEGYVDRITNTRAWIGP